MAHNERPEELLRGKDQRISAYVYIDGAPRELLTKGDTVTFRICEFDNHTTVRYSLTNDAGVTVSDSGKYIVAIADTDLPTSTLPKDIYWYEIEFTNGETGMESQLRAGELTLVTTP